MKINSTSFNQEVLQSEVPVIVDFYADWCGPCKMMAPVLDAFEQNANGSVKVVKINVDESSELAAQFGIMTIPTLMVFKNGKMTARHTGVIPGKAVSSLVNA